MSNIEDLAELVIEEIPVETGKSKIINVIATSRNSESSYQSAPIDEIEIEEITPIDSATPDLPKREERSESPFEKKMSQHLSNNFDDLYLRISFRFSIFLKYFSYHLIFFTLGPVGSLCISLCEGYYSVYNMGFWGCTRTFAMQISHYSLLWIGIILLLLSDDISEIDCAAAAFMTILRSFIISCRYAYTPQTILNSYKKYRWSLKKRENEFLVQGWIFLKDKLIDKEIMTALVRSQIEVNTFSFTFLHSLTPQWQGMLSHSFWQKVKRYSTVKNMRRSTVFSLPKDVLREMQKEEDEETSRRCKSINLGKSCEISYSGRILADILLQLSNTIKTPKFTMICLLFIAIINGFVPIFSRSVLDTNSELTPFGYSYSFLPITYTILMIILNIFAGYINFMFLVLGVLDFRRRLFINRLLNRLIDKNVAHVEILPKTYIDLNNIPFINIFMSQSIINWLKLKILMRHLGDKFLKRICAYVETFFVLYSGTFIFLFLVAFDIISTVKLSITFLTFACLQLLFVSGIIFSYIWIGAKNNNQYSSEIYFWNRHMTTLQDMSYNYQSLLEYSEDNLMEFSYKEGIKNLRTEN